MTNYDLILDEIKKNRPCCNEHGRIIDVNLICNLLRTKYNSIEINEVAILLINKIENCIYNNQSWFTDN